MTKTKASLLKCGLLLLVILPGAGSCSSNQEDKLIYRDGREWSFRVHFIAPDQRVTDSCTIELASGEASPASVISGQKGLTYTYGNCVDNKTYSETTGVAETDKEVFIHSPRLGMFAFTEVAPFTSIALPAELITSEKGELHVSRSTFKPAENKTIRQLLERTDTDSLKIGKKVYSCYLLEGKNTSHIAELGQVQL